MGSVGGCQDYNGEGEWGCLKSISYATDSIIFKLSGHFMMFEVVTWFNENWVAIGWGDSCSIGLQAKFLAQLFSLTLDSTLKAQPVQNNIIERM